MSGLQMLPTAEYTPGVLQHTWRRPAYVLAGTLLICMLCCFGPTDNWSWDPSFYYAQLRSPIIDHDVSFYGETIPGYGIPGTGSALIPSPWPIGPALFWAPFFLLAHIYTLIIAPGMADGYWPPYIVLVSLGSVLYSVAGLALIYRICRLYTDRFLALLASILCLGATPLFFYTFRQPIMAHTTGFFTTAIIVLAYALLERGQLPICWSGLIFGVGLGLVFLVRWSGIMIGVFPLVFFGKQLLEAWRKHDKMLLRVVILQIAGSAAIVLMVIAPQLALWQRIHGTPLHMPQGGDTFVTGLLPINALAVLFATNRGLLFWAPFILIGAVGLLYVPDRAFSISGMLYLIGLVVLIGYRVDWYSGGGFGPRYFIETLPVIAVGFAAFWRRQREQRFLRGVLIAGAILLVAHQLMLVYSVEHAVEPGWVNLEHYLKGEPTGVAFQIESARRLLSNPTLLFAPRPFVADDRQVLLVHLLSGRWEGELYRITGPAGLLAPGFVLGGAWLRGRLKVTHIPSLAWIVVSYMLIWSVYLLIL